MGNSVNLSFPQDDPIPILHEHEHRRTLSIPQKQPDDNDNRRQLERLDKKKKVIWEGLPADDEEAGA